MNRYPRFFFLLIDITGLSCYSVFTYSKDNWEKKANTVFFPKEFRTHATEYENKFEKDALCEYAISTKQKLLQIGLVICKKFPWLAYSPDAIIVDEPGCY